MNLNGCGAYGEHPAAARITENCAVHPRGRARNTSCFRASRSPPASPARSPALRSRRIARRNVVHDGTAPGGDCRAARSASSRCTATTFPPHNASNARTSSVTTNRSAPRLPDPRDDPGTGTGRSEPAPHRPLRHPQRPRGHPYMACRQPTRPPQLQQPAHRRATHLNPHGLRQRTPLPHHHTTGKTSPDPKPPGRHTAMDKKHRFRGSGDRAGVPPHDSDNHPKHRFHVSSRCAPYSYDQHESTWLTDRHCQSPTDSKPAHRNWAAS